NDAVPMIAAAEHQAGCLPRFQRQFRRDDAIRAAANSVGAEIFANHDWRPHPLALSASDISRLLVLVAAKILAHLPVWARDIQPRTMQIKGITEIAVNAFALHPYPDRSPAPGPPPLHPNPQR